MLEFGVLNNNGMILLTGEPGTGKTTLLQKILSTMAPTVMVGRFTFTQDKGGSLLPWVLKAFGLQSDREQSADLLEVFTEFFKTKVQEQQGLLLVVDEAQNLDVAKLEELRLLFNLNDHQGAVLQILLAGHTQLREQLHDPHLQAFVQRIGTDFSLEPFNQEDTKAYILHRVQAVGGRGSLFADAACALVYRYTHGNPRLINQLCETSLLYGFADRMETISEHVVAEAANDRLQNVLLPLTPLDEVTLDAERKEAPEPMKPEGTLAQPIPMNSGGEAVRPIEDSSRRWEEAMKLMEQGWYLEAIRRLKDLAGHSTYHRRSWHHVGQCYAALGRHQDALDAFHLALGDSPEQPPESAPIYHAMGQVLATLGRHEEAKRYIDLTRLAAPGFVADPNIHFHSPSLQSSKGTVSMASRHSWFIRTLRSWWLNFR